MCLALIFDIDNMQNAQKVNAQLRYYHSEFSIWGVTVFLWNLRTHKPKVTPRTRIWYSIQIFSLYICHGCFLSCPWSREVGSKTTAYITAIALGVSGLTFQLVEVPNSTSTVYPSLFICINMDFPPPFFSKGGRFSDGREFSSNIVCGRYPTEVIVAENRRGPWFFSPSWRIFPWRGVTNLAKTQGRRMKHLSSSESVRPKLLAIQRAPWWPLPACQMVISCMNLTMTMMTPPWPDYSTTRYPCPWCLKHLKDPNKCMYSTCTVVHAYTYCGVIKSDRISKCVTELFHNCAIVPFSKCVMWYHSLCECMSVHFQNLLLFRISDSVHFQNVSWLLLLVIECCDI